MDVSVKVTGLKQFRSAIKKVDSDLPKELRKELGGIAVRLASKISAKVPHRSGDAASSVVGRSGGLIAFGGTKAPYYPWLDFGGRVGRNKSVSRPIVPGGRWVYPTIAENSEETEREVDRVIAQLAASAGFETKD